MGSLRITYILSTIFTAGAACSYGLLKGASWTKIIPLAADNSYSDILSMALVSFIVLHILIVGHYLAKDALYRGKSRKQQFWACLLIFGVLIYHFFFGNNLSYGQILRRSFHQQYGEPHNHKYSQRYSASPRYNRQAHQQYGEPHNHKYSQRYSQQKS